MLKQFFVSYTDVTGNVRGFFTFDSESAANDFALECASLYSLEFLTVGRIGGNKA